MMKKIVFVEKNFEALDKQIAEANGKARTRTLSIDDVKAVLKEADEHLGISKAAKKGVKLTYRHGEKLPKAYKYIPESTQFKAEFNGTAWVITDIYRGICPGVIKDTALELTEAAKKAIIESKLSF